MTEDEYYDGEPDDYEGSDEIEVEFLIDEPSDLDMLLLPKTSFNLKDELELFYKEIRKCRNKNQILEIAEIFYSRVYNFAVLENDIRHLQNRAKELELRASILNLK